MVDYSDIFNTETFCYGDILFLRRCTTGDVVLRTCSVTETFCIRFVDETFCKEMFCMCAEFVPTTYSKVQVLGIQYFLNAMLYISLNHIV
jgi:hypothetical protein